MNSKICVIVAKFCEEIIYENRNNYRSHIGWFIVFVCVNSYWLNVFPQPEFTGNPKTFMDGLAASGYILPVVKFFELLCGLAFVSGRFVALAVVLIFPIA